MLAVLLFTDKLSGLDNDELQNYNSIWFTSLAKISQCNHITCFLIVQNYPLHFHYSSNVLITCLLDEAKEQQCVSVF